MIQSPKVHFQTNPVAVKGHADTVSTEEFQHALEIALLEYSKECAKESEPMAGYYKSRGAFEFARTLCSLHVPPTQRQTKDLDNLE